MQEYGKKYEQDGVVLPILCVRDDGFDPETFLEVSGMQWNQYLSLKLLEIVFSVFTFSTKISMFFFSFGRSLESLLH